MADTTTPQTVQQLVAAALPGAIQAAVTADPMRFVEAGLAAEVDKLKHEAQLAFQTAQLKVQALLQIHHSSSSIIPATAASVAATTAKIDVVLAGGAVGAPAA